MKNINEEELNYLNDSNEDEDIEEDYEIDDNYLNDSNEDEDIEEDYEIDDNYLNEDINEEELNYLNDSNEDEDIEEDYEIDEEAENLAPLNKELVEKKVKKINNENNTIKLIKWSTTNIKNIANYEEEINLLTNKEIVNILKTAKTNIIKNKIDNKTNIQIIKDINEININTNDIVEKMHKYYLICISLGLIQKKILLEKQAFVNFEYIQEEIKKLLDLKNFLLDYAKKEEELKTLITIAEYFETVKKKIGAIKK